LFDAAVSARGTDAGNVGDANDADAPRARLRGDIDPSRRSITARLSQPAPRLSVTGTNLRISGHVTKTQ